MPGVSLNILYEALGSQFGVSVQCSAGDADKVRAKLYALRKEHNDSDLNCLAIAQSPSDPNVLWIVKVTR